MRLIELLSLNFKDNKPVELDIFSIGRHTETRVGISGTTVKSSLGKFVPSSHLGPFAVVAS